MSDDFRNQVAIITGAFGAIGSAVAARLYQSGAQLVLVDKMEVVQSTNPNEFPNALLVGADVTDEHQVQGYVEQALSAFGRIDLFFNNAGVEGKVCPLTETSLADFDSVMAVNTRGVFLGLREVMKAFQKQGTGGAIVNSASMAGFRGGPGLAPYVASKHAVIGLTRNAALEGAEWGIRVNAVAPGYIDSRMLHSINSQLPRAEASLDTTQNMIRQVPMKRLGSPEDVAAAVCWLLSPEASYVTGTVTVIDGGLNC
ncbi:SDR family NAD(P)-dependent oxidoreductase [Alicyclobacillus kakegawensis]|uniref:SDR family NAD(P)-dependent oxidoreductase n=1 Tax=Alicyclobacillus kakegawensis TaxID=392012 RepID=UPI00082E05AC|nr:glucose 1-dehydrogenase [Alicyclobacillus kakegawensis]